MTSYHAPPAPPEPAPDRAGRRSEVAADAERLIALAERWPGGLPDPAERRRLRRACGLSQLHVAALIGADRATLSRWENGSLPSPAARLRYGQLLARLDEIDREGRGAP